MKSLNMGLIRLLGLFLGLSLTANALLRGGDFESLSNRRARTRLAHSQAKRNAFPLKNFIISDMFTHTFADPVDTTWNRTISFVFADLNSNSSTICTDSWRQSNTTNSYPTSYVSCDYTGDEEVFEWQFLSYTDLANFRIELVHSFSDPADYPPPWNVVTYFALSTTFNLSCTTNQGYTGCYLPTTDSPLRVPINAAVD